MASSKRPTTSTSMKDMPTEILEQIFQWTKCDRGRDLPGVPYKMDGLEYRGGISITEDPNLTNPNDENPCYKSFRLVCRLWHDIATPLLLENVVLLSHIDSWKKFDAICTRPHLARHVRTIQVATIRDLEHYSDATDLQSGVWRPHDNPVVEQHEPYASYPNGGPLAKLPRDMESTYQRYQQWHNGEVGMVEHWRKDTTPTLHLSLLTNLRRVETIGHSELAVVQKKMDKPLRRGQWSFWRVYPASTRREIETSIGDLAVIGRKRWAYDGQHLDLFLNALHKAGVSLPTLALRSGQDLVRHFHRTLPFNSLRRLELNIGPHEIKRIYMRDPGSQPGEINDYWRVSEWVQHLTGLKELSIVMDSAVQADADIFEMLWGIRFPQLRSVYLKNVRMTYGTFKAFIQAHRHSIQILNVEEPLLPSEDLDRLRMEERVSDWRAEGKQLRLTDIYVAPPNASESEEWWD